MVAISGVAVLKKHYCNLFKSLPDDFISTLEKLHGLVEIKEGVEDFVVSCGSPEQSNKKIIDLLIAATNGETLSDRNMLAFCDLMEAIVTPEMMEVVHKLRNGV